MISVLQFSFCEINHHSNWVSKENMCLNNIISVSLVYENTPIGKIATTSRY